jgi:hypothetical protein
MTQISYLAEQLKSAFPLAHVEEDPPVHPTGNHHLDIRLGDRLVVVEWRPTQGFGVSLVCEAALDDGPDFRTAHIDEALQYAARLLRLLHPPSSRRLDRDPEWRRAA